jgi:hypothetical protein
MDTKAIEEAIRSVLDQARGFAVPCAFIIAVTMGVIMGWDLLGALIRAAGRSKPRGPKHHQVW